MDPLTFLAVTLMGCFLFTRAGKATMKIQMRRHKTTSTPTTLCERREVANMFAWRPSMEDFACAERIRLSRQLCITPAE